MTQIRVFGVEQPIDVGDRKRARWTVTNEAGSLADPAEMYFRIRSPAGVETTYEYLVDAELVRESLGTFSSAVTFDDDGSWWLRAKADGDIIDALEVEVRVRKSAFVSP